MIRGHKGILAPLGVLILTATALAYWTASGTGSANAGVGTLSAPSNVTAQASSGESPVSVPVSWGASHVSPSGLDSEITYTVERSKNGGGWNPADGTCSGTLTGTACDDSVTASGTYTYRVTAHFRSWTASGTSDPVVVTVLTAPTLTSKPSDPSANASPNFSFSGGGGTGYECELDGGGFASCTSPKSYSSLAGGSHTFKVHAVAGASSGPNTTYTWTIDTSAPTITDRPADPSPNASFSFTHTRAAYGFKCKLDAGSFTSCSSPKNYLPGTADGSHTFTVEAVDQDGVATQSTTPYSWLLDTIKPQTTATGADNNWHNTAVTVGLSASDPGYSAIPKTGSGVATLHYNVDGGTQQNVPGSNGTASTNVTINAPSNGTNDGDHTITYWSTDAAGNDENQGTVHVKIDTQGPAQNVSLTNATGAYLNGTTLYFKSNAAGSFKFTDPITDSRSGPASVTYPQLTATNWTTHNAETVTTGPSYTSSTFSWSASAGTPASYTITGADAIGNTSSFGPITFTPDTTNPTGSISYTNGYPSPPTSSPQVTLTAADAGSGIATRTLQRAGTTLSNDSCTTPTSFATIATNPGSPYSDSGVTSGNCYKYQYVVTDNVGNTVTFTSTNILKVDLISPTLALTFPANGGAYTTAGWKNSGAAVCGTGERVCGTASDSGGSGIAGLSSVQVQLEQNFGSHNCFGGASFNVTNANCNSSGWLAANAGTVANWLYNGIKGTEFGVPSGQTQSFIARARVTDRAGNTTVSGNNTFTVSN